ncbi:hypothetical protein HNR42_000248 [Deinobacterium chartae]|uniref:Calcineurin-like phosphoesterase domain-containing protein n=1 Tax=Deinobacterium chartae TaxID=521158 RepID=A0A841HV90_9DEIO|nr:metallophosphoesterase [Deinobacterium chartae]MBB6096836.1 hypothetical protein [Deinobacterium chartae]
MNVYAIADPHLSRARPKPMDIFGGNWSGHPAAFFEGWRETVGPDDLVLVPGDISWAMRLEEARLDLEDIAALPGIKVLSRGNHDYWWPSISRLRAALPPGMHALQNDALRIGNVVVCGSRGWVCPGSEGFTDDDEKIYTREVERLRLSLEAARTLAAPEQLPVVVMLHYPPTNSAFEPSGFTALIERYLPSGVTYGHLHGVNPDRLLKHWCGIPLHFVAADALRFRPKRILGG